MVCHPEYILEGRDQTVFIPVHPNFMSCIFIHSTTHSLTHWPQGIVVHFDGVRVSIYFATFPSDYLHILRNVDVDKLQSRDPKIELRHTRLYNLMNTEDRTYFIKEFVALLRFVAAGQANVGHLWKESSAIHRDTDMRELVEDPVLHPPQEDLNESEEEAWRTLHAMKYTA